MDNAKQFSVKLCDTCNGSGKRIYDYHGNPSKIAKSYGDAEYIVFDDQAYDPEPCYVCHGMAYTRRNGIAYKSEAMKNRMLSNGSATKCHHCDNDGMMWKIPAIQKCHDCRAVGFVLVYDSESTIIPDVIDLYGYLDHDFSARWAEEVEIIVERTGKSLSWGESYLGLGSIWSSVDYGNHWEMTDDEVIVSIRQRLIESGFQLISLCDKTTRMLSRTVVVKLTANGYSLIAAGKTNDSYALPPAYNLIVDLPVDVANNIIGA